jgi:ubiquinone/menaquinone biosynthesis C-methylase UbiE
MTVAMARQLGADSHVFSTDINEERLREIRAAVEEAALKNVTVLVGDAVRTNLPDGCCDAVFVRHVYHHFGDPAAMNASIRRALKPGGRLAVLDFSPRKAVTGPVPPEQRGSGDTHGVTSETVVDELKAAGFEVLEVIPEWPGQLYCVLARSPGL